MQIREPSFYRGGRWWVLLAVLALVPAGSHSPSTALAADDKAPQDLSLQSGLMCEDVKDFEPVNPAVVFSVAFGQVACYTFFDAVPQRTIIYHNWYRRDVLNTKVRLLVKPPRWRTFSKIQLRASDKGPWRVEVTDADGAVLGLVRFSITD
jgi:hypothetical protein